MRNVLMPGYVSQELTHFIGAREPTDEDRFRLLLKIIRDGTLLDGKSLRPRKLSPVSFFDVVDKGGSVSRQEYFPQPYYDTDVTAPLDSNQFVKPDSVCFCDIPFEPVEHFRIHTSKYNRFGLAFNRQFLVKQGANPVFYIAKSAATALRLLGSAGPYRDFYLDETVNSLFGSSRTRGEFFNELNARLLALIESNADATQRQLETYQRGKSDPYEHKQRVYRSIDLPITLFPYLFGYTKFFDPELPENHPHNYYMEREWRVLGKVTFTIADVTCVLLPPEFVQRFREAAPEYTGPIIELPNPSAA